MPLLSSQISQIQILSDEWHQARLFHYTSSENHNLMGEKPFTQGALSYIYRKVGEQMTGISAKDIIETQATVHGNVYEPEALRKYKEKNGIKFMVEQKLIYGVNPRFSSTPDAIELLGLDDKGNYRTKTVEIKCPLTYEAYIRLFLCDTPFDVKKEEKAYFIQVLDQMEVCGAMEGCLVVYHPDFKQGQMKVIDFRLMELFDGKRKLLEEYNLLKQRKEMALKKHDEIVLKLSA